MEVDAFLFVAIGFLAVCVLLAFVTHSRDHATQKKDLSDLKKASEAREKELQQQISSLSTKVLVIETRLEERSAQAERSNFRFVAYEDYGPKATPLSPYPTREILEHVKRGPGRPPGAKNKEKPPEMIQG